MRGNGTVGTTTSMSKSSLISSPCLSATAWKATASSFFLHRGDVFVRVDPAELGVDRRELGRVTARERRVGAEHVTDLEHLAEAGSLRHLLEVLRALREVGGLVAEVLQGEQLGVALGGRRHELGGVDLDVVALDPVRAHRVLEGRLNAEDEVVAALAQVDEAPVHALVEAAVGGDRRLGQGRGGDLEAGDLDLDAAELDALVVLEVARDGEEGARRQLRDERREGERRGILLRGVGVGAGRGVHELHGAGLVTQDDELHLLLIADGLDPSRDPDGSVFAGLQLADEGAFGHEGPVYAGAPAGASAQVLVTWPA